jgi:hypothetical protein
MDATPDKFYDVPLPPLPRLRISDLQRLPRLPLPAVALSAMIEGGHRWWYSGGKGARSWWASRALDAVLGTLVIASGLLVGFAIGLFV